MKPSFMGGFVFLDLEPESKSDMVVERRDGLLPRTNNAERIASSAQSEHFPNAAESTRSPIAGAKSNMTPTI